ncbi:DUF4302 domain-containing protein [Aquimarina algiphila]|uniref:DUF4302 domain-containing protein n=1 Tax=Aquimarina algiphila TaxID=2047982 RepID=UPI00232FD7F1|nr:DUF4302 domain-containing protein [Aquimarina algiphila]
MLKNIKIHIFLFITLSFIACSNDNDVDPVFDTDVDSRVDEQLKSYKSILTAPEFGWTLDYQPENSQSIFKFHLKFNDDNTAEMTSDYMNGENDLPTTYRVGRNQIPELIFENYSTLHSLFEAQNFSLGAEFELNFQEVSSEKIVLRSKTDQGEEKSIITLIPATATDKDEVIILQGLEARIKDGHLTTDFFRTLKVTNNLSMSEVYSSNFTFNDNTRRVSFSGTDSDDNVLSYDLPLKITEAGFDLLTPFSFNGTDFQSFIYDMGTNTFKATIDDLTVIISASTEPGFISNDFLLIQNGTRSTFGYRPTYGNAQFMDDEFLEIFTTIDANLAPNGLTMSIYFFSLDFSTPTPTANMTFRATDGTTNFNGNYNFNVSIVDKKFFFTFIGSTDANGAFFQSRIQPLLDFWTSPNGLLYTERGNFRTENNSFSNQSGSFFSIDNPISSYVIWFN